MLKVAMIGAGGYAYELIKRMWTLPDKYELIAVSSNPNRRSAGKNACAEKSVEIYPDPDSMLDAVKGRVDVVFVPTPIHTHKPLAEKCIEAGFDVFLEKPPVATIQELDELDAYAKRNNKKVAVMFQSLYTSILTRLKDVVIEGKLGKINRVRGVAAWPRMDDYFGRSGWAGRLKVNGDWVLDGTINNPLAHMLSNQLYLASGQPGTMAEPASVTAELYHGHDIESEDTSSLRVMTVDGVEVIFNASLCPENQIEPTVMVDCENGSIEYYNFNKAVITYADGKKEYINDEKEQRIYMLERLCDLYTTGKQFNCSLETCRPFTIVVNAAFESCGKIHSIPRKYILRFEQGDTIKTVIRNIDSILKVAYENGQIFSETSLEWAKQSVTVDTTNYKEFKGQKLF
jgi:predicted dehydrogenase